MFISCGVAILRVIKGADKITEYNPFKKEFWTWGNLSDKEQREYDKKLAEENKEVKAKVKAYENQKDRERAEEISDKLQTKLGVKTLARGEVPDWKTCPKCNGKNVKLISRSRNVMYLWGAGILMILIGLIIWPLLIPGVLFILLCWVPLVLPKQKKCRDCTNAWY